MGNCTSKPFHIALVKLVSRVVLVYCGHSMKYSILIYNNVNCHGDVLYRNAY